MRYCTFLLEFLTLTEEACGWQPCRALSLPAFQNYSEKGNFFFSEHIFLNSLVSPSPEVFGFLACRNLVGKVRMRTQTHLYPQSWLYSPQDPATQHLRVPENEQTHSSWESRTRRAWLSQTQKPVFWINCFSKQQGGREDNCVILQPLCSRVCSLG